jgi:alkanesulfonate monooxygenase SsuD/methylene tetrahydromethanopterin reductase-like flavin-dependent oxidoreductase (luciferase family)
LAHVAAPYRLAARAADVVYITPHDVEELARIESELRAQEVAVGRGGDPLRVFVDVVVFLDDHPGAAAARKAHLDELDDHVFRSDALVFTGTPAHLADHLESWRHQGIAGFRLRPGVQPHDLQAISRQLVPLLQARGAFRRAYAESSLRARLGLARPTNRYATTISR